MNYRGTPGQLRLREIIIHSSADASPYATGLSGIFFGCPPMNPIVSSASLEGLEIEILKLVSYSATPEQWKEWLRVALEHARPLEATL